MSVIEHRTFRLAAGTDEAAFVAADAEFQTGVVYQAPGVARRTVARSDGGEWLVETLWASAAHATASPEPDPGSALAAMIDPASVSVRRYETIG